MHICRWSLVWGYGTWKNLVLNPLFKQITQGRRKIPKCLIWFILASIGRLHDPQTFSKHNLYEWMNLSNLLCVCALLLSMLKFSAICIESENLKANAFLRCFFDRRDGFKLETSSKIKKIDTTGSRASYSLFLSSGLYCNCLELAKGIEPNTRDPVFDSPVSI